MEKKVGGQGVGFVATGGVVVKGGGSAVGNAKEENEEKKRAEEGAWEGSREEGPHEWGV